MRGEGYIQSDEGGMGAILGLFCGAAAGVVETVNWGSSESPLDLGWRKMAGRVSESLRGIFECVFFGRVEEKSSSGSFFWVCLSLR